jgi:hypothetical protein
VRAFIGDRYPELLEEMRGIAEGAGRALEEIVALNPSTSTSGKGKDEAFTPALPGIGR